MVGADPARGVFEDGHFLHPVLDFAIDFPAGWQTQNTDEAAGAISPAKDAVVALRMAAPKATLDQVLQKAAADGERRPASSVSR